MWRVEQEHNVIRIFYYARVWQQEGTVESTSGEPSYRQGWLSRPGAKMLARGKRRGFCPGAAARHRGRTRVPSDSYMLFFLVLILASPFSPFSSVFEIGRLLVLRPDFRSDFRSVFIARTMKSDHFPDNEVQLHCLISDWGDIQSQKRWKGGPTTAERWNVK